MFLLAAEFCPLRSFLAIKVQHFEIFAKMIIMIYSDYTDVDFPLMFEN